jgi:hypothetical protein
MPDLTGGAFLVGYLALCAAAAYAAYWMAGKQR